MRRGVRAAPYSLRAKVIQMPPQGNRFPYRDAVLRLALTHPDRPKWLDAAVALIRSEIFSVDQSPYEWMDRLVTFAALARQNEMIAASSPRLMLHAVGSDKPQHGATWSRVTNIAPAAEGYIITYHPGATDLDLMAGDRVCIGDVPCEVVKEAWHVTHPRHRVLVTVKPLGVEPPVMAHDAVIVRAI